MKALSKWLKQHFLLFDVVRVTLGVAVVVGLAFVSVGAEHLVGLFDRNPNDSLWDGICGLWGLARLCHYNDNDHRCCDAKSTLGSIQEVFCLLSGARHLFEQYDGWV